MRQLVERARRRAMIRCAISGCAAAFRLDGAGEARRRRRLPLARTRPARGAVGGARRSTASAIRTICRCSRTHRPGRDAEPDAKLPPMPLGAHVVEDYRRLSLSLKAHPVAFMRARLTQRGIMRSDALGRVTSGERVDGRRAGAGAPASGHRQGRDLHDAGGRDRRRQHHRLAEGVRTPARDRHRRPLRRRDRANCRTRSGVIHIIAERMEDLTPMLGQLSDEGRDIETLAPSTKSAARN